MFKQLIAPLFLALAASAAFTIDSPAINQCKDVEFKISGNQGKVRLQVLPSDKPCEHDPIADSGEFDVQNGVYKWTGLNVPAGTSVVVVADDDSDSEAWTSTIVIGGSASDCPVSAITRTTATATSATRSSTRSSNTATNAPVNAADSNTTSGAVSLGVSLGAGSLALVSAFAVLF